MRRGGFTLIELLVVMAIIATLLTIAVPRYFGQVDRAKETTLKQTLAVTRDAIDKYHGDKGRYPDSLEQLVAERYLRALPIDPIIDTAANWTLVPPPEGGAPGAVADLRSSAPGSASDGTAYSSW